MLRKANSSNGFDPAVALDASMTVPNRESQRMDGRLDALVLSPTLHRLLMTMARIKNVYSSLKIEGVDIDLNEARAVVESGTALNAPQRTTLRFAQEYARIHEWQPSQVPELTVAYLENLHGRLLRDDPTIEPDHMGVLKPVQNYIIDRNTGQAIYEPTPPDRTRAELESLFAWFDATEHRLPPAVLAGVFFAEFQCIHPFTDGNGRIGRLVNMMVLKRLGFQNIALTPLDGCFFQSQDRYYEKLRATNQGMLHVWNRYYCKQLEKAYRIAVRRGDLRSMIDAQRGEVAHNILEWVFAGDGSWFQRSHFPNPRGFSGAALTNALRSLAEQGILENRGEKRGREHRLSTRYLKRVYGGDFLKAL